MGNDLSSTSGSSGSNMDLGYDSWDDWDDYWDDLDWDLFTGYGYHKEVPCECEEGTPEFCALHGFSPSDERKYDGEKKRVQDAECKHKKKLTKRHLRQQLLKGSLLFRIAQSIEWRLKHASGDKTELEEMLEMIKGRLHKPLNLSDSDPLPKMKLPEFEKFELLLKQYDQALLGAKKEAHQERQKKREKKHYPLHTRSHHVDWADDMELSIWEEDEGDDSTCSPPPSPIILADFFPPHLMVY